MIRPAIVGQFALLGLSSLARVRFASMTRDETEKAFRSLHPSIANGALAFLDKVLDATKAQNEASLKQR